MRIGIVGMMVCSIVGCRSGGVAPAFAPSPEDSSAGQPRADEPPTIVVSGDAGPGWQVVDVVAHAVLPTDPVPRRMCFDQLRLPEAPPVIIEVRDRPLPLRIGVERSTGFAILAPDGQVHCSPMLEGGRVEDLQVALGVGRHAVFIEWSGGYDNPKLRWARMFQPSQDQLTAWVAHKDLTPTRPPVLEAAMGKSIVVPMRKGYCVRYYVIHRPASTDGDVSRFVSFSRTTREGGKKKVMMLEPEERDGEVGMMARGTSYCSLDGSRVEVTSSYLDGQPPARGDRLEVRAFTWKDEGGWTPSPETARYYDCKGCHDSYWGCRDRRGENCTGQYRRCVRVVGRSMKQCGDP